MFNIHRNGAIPAATALEPKAPTEQIIQDGMRLLHYVARHGNLKLDQQLVESFSKTCERYGSKYWNSDDEVALLSCFDELARQVYPVTVESIKAVIPDAETGTLSSPQAGKIICWYRRYTVATLFCLLLVQMFYIFGSEITHSLTQKQSSPAVETAVHSGNYDDALLERDANYRLLQGWNAVWMLGQHFHMELPQHVKNQLSGSHALLRSQDMLDYYADIIAAKSALNMLQSYVLPLLYGLLGAFIFVLRSLLQQIHDLTYTPGREIGYRLRLTLGSLAGMITGWVLKPDMISGAAQLSPMAIAFIAGYSIEVLFAILDKIIESIRRNTSGDTNN
ncbi:hypothetical protein [Celerinatantimonas sp. YJH-8]|uniref:hypothetical protein n=1 Tax=Celerinatantimonas sp. YJH-8 TaxID=3228714 RepID=UPI0038CBE496